MFLVVLEAEKTRLKGLADLASGQGLLTAAPHGRRDERPLQGPFMRALIPLMRAEML